LIIPNILRHAMFSTWLHDYLILPHNHLELIWVGWEGFIMSHVFSFSFVVKFVLKVSLHNGGTLWFPSKYVTCNPIWYLKSIVTSTNFNFKIFFIIFWKIHNEGVVFMWMVVVARPSSTKATEPSSRIFTDPVYVCEDNTLGPQFNLDDFDWHYVYVCTKVHQGCSFN
jgi:hypothetical protein